MLTYSEINSLIARVAWDHDHNRGLGVAEFFTHDGIYRLPTGETIVGKSAIAQFFRARDLGDRVARNVFTNITIVKEHGAEAEVDSLMTVYAGKGPGPHPAKPGALLDCSDHLVRADGIWLIRRRTLTIVFRTPT